MYTLICKGRLVVLDKPVVMGIINLTPDSFYKNSRHQDLQSVIDKAGDMLEQGAIMLDVGGQSTRPGSDFLEANEELQRVLPAIEALHQHFPQAILSIDTFWSQVAKAAVHAGASIVNDISAGKIDAAMYATVGSLNVPYVLMHMKGTPQTMQQMTNYNNLLTELLDFFIREKDQLHKAGVHDVIIDPGFGFAKTVQQNFTLLKKLSHFKLLQAPIMFGISRKSIITKTLNCAAADALNGTSVLNTLGLMNGAGILRVHDVKEAMECIQLYQAYTGA